MPTTLNPSNQTITQYNIQTGGASNLLNNVAPSATSGVPVISQGAAAQPVFGTAVVAGGGTGIATATAYSVICAGTTATGAFQSLAALGAANTVLTSNGAGALPSFQAITATSAFTQVVVQVFTSSGTYTPTTGMKYCTLEVVGGGGGGGATTNTTAAQVSSAGGGGGGGYARKTVTAATIGASQVVTIGAAGTAGSTSGGGGGTGGTTSVGAIISATGGIGGGGAGASLGTAQGGGAGGVGSSGDININGNGGGCSVGFATGGIISGFGGSSYFGGGVSGKPLLSGSTAGGPGRDYGGGGGGGCCGVSGTAVAGGAGFKGVVVITEYVSA